MSDEPRPFEVPARLLQNAFKDGAILTVNRKGRTIERPLTVARICELQVQSGGLIVGDVGMSFQMAEPFVRRVLPGMYEVLVSIWGMNGRGSGPSDEMGDCARAAYMGLLLSHDPPVRYEFAATGDQPREWLPHDPYDGFGVDMGGVGLLDAKYLDAVCDLSESTDFFALEDAAHEERPDLVGVAGCVRMPTRPPLIIPMCDSGWGDGSYFSYWGVNAADDPVILIVDFDLDGKWSDY